MNVAFLTWNALDRLVTDTAQDGFYVVYLFAADLSGVYLSLNHGTTAILKQAGGRKYLKVLTDTAARDAGWLSAEDTSGLVAGPIDLGGSGQLARAYGAASVLAAFYAAGANPATEDVLETDLTQFLLLYQTLIEARAAVGADLPDAPEVTFTGVEAKRFRWHRRRAQPGPRP